MNKLFLLIATSFMVFNVMAQVPETKITTVKSAAGYEYITVEMWSAGAGKNYARIANLNKDVNHFIWHGEMNGDDLKAMREKLNANTAGASNPFEYRICLDLADATIKAGGTFKVGVNEYTIDKDDVIPSYAFAELGTQSTTLFQVGS